MWPGRPATQRQRAENSKNRRLDLLLDDFEIARGLALLDPIDQHAQHVDIRRRAGTDMVDAGRRVEPRELRRLRLAQLALDVFEIADAGIGALRIVGHMFEHDQLAAPRTETAEIRITRGPEGGRDD